MSRKIETAILQALANHPGRRFSVSELAGIVYGLQPNPNTVYLGMRQADAVGRVFRDRQRWPVLVPAFRLASVSATTSASA
jgi:hypothetical protein